MPDSTHANESGTRVRERYGVAVHEFDGDGKLLFIDEFRDEDVAERYAEEVETL